MTENQSTPPFPEQHQSKPRLETVSSSMTGEALILLGGDTTAA
jgi:hypothetical protein